MSIKFIGKAKITKQGQVTLPFEAREELKLDLNSEIYWYLVDDHLVVVKDLVSVDDLILLIFFIEILIINIININKKTKTINNINIIIYKCYGLLKLERKLHIIEKTLNKSIS